MTTFKNIDNNGLQMILDNTNKSVSIDPDNGIVIKYDLLTANPKTFTISNTGMNFLDNTENNTTFLSRIALLQQALASVEIPPNPTTFEVVSSLLVRDTGTNSIALDGVVPSVIITDGTDTNTITINSIDATGGLTLPSVVAFTNAVAPTCLANPQGSTDLCNKQYVDSQSALTAYQLYFNYSVPYTVPSGSTYRELSSIQVATPTTVAWTTSSTAPVFLGGFFNLLSTLNITSITAGVWTLLLFANLTSVAGQGREAFFYTIIGTDSAGAETILYTSPASLLLNTVTPLIGSVSIQGTIPLISLTGYTGLGIKLYIQANTATLTTGSVIYQTPSEYSSILTSVLPISAITTLDQVLTAGNNASGLSITNLNNVDLVSINSTSYPLPTPSWNDTLSVNNQANQNINMNFYDILQCNNINTSLINGLSPTTIGLTWGDFTGTNAYSNLPNQRFQVDSGGNNTNQYYDRFAVFNSATPCYTTINSAGMELLDVNSATTTYYGSNNISSNNATAFTITAGTSSSQPLNLNCSQLNINSVPYTPLRPLLWTNGSGAFMIGAGSFQLISTLLTLNLVSNQPYIMSYSLSIYCDTHMLSSAMYPQFYNANGLVSGTTWDGTHPVASTGDNSTFSGGTSQFLVNDWVSFTADSNGQLLLDFYMGASSSWNGNYYWSFNMNILSP